MKFQIESSLTIGLVDFIKVKLESSQLFWRVKFLNVDHLSP